MKSNVYKKRIERAKKNYSEEFKTMEAMGTEMGVFDAL